MMGDASRQPVSQNGMGGGVTKRDRICTTWGSARVRGKYPRGHGWWAEPQGWKVALMGTFLPQLPQAERANAQHGGQRQMIGPLWRRPAAKRLKCCQPTCCSLRQHASRPRQPPRHAGCRRFPFPSAPRTPRTPPMTAQLSRLRKELVEFQQFPAFAGGPGDDLRHWKVAFQGPAQTPFEGGTFHLAVAFPLEYPFKPPQVRFTSRVFHPNVSSAGDICLDVLKAEWSPVLSICRVLISIQSLLDDPNAMSPLNGDAARLFRENRAQYERQVRKYVRAYASE
ncbi:Ubiquitin-conjugating enzyme E2 [Spironucleus salmonicida]|uniref:Ubiquitin-conjugating enzyme E2 n=1 Tax=Spironucleus salmonicida TaxID=348837 RepID=A0A9P8RXX9_9EUKA|nr:Ubiquitin-conjugating enzyme E2 [Spironucleus salmonicida]